MTGRVFNIQRFCIHDGPGIRTTVFLQGCPLRCTWCHNPEGVGKDPLLSFIPERCIGCGCCLRVCPRGSHRMDGGVHVLDRDKCVVCGSCARECFAEALELIGKDMGVEEVLREVLADRVFYETSGGGMTLSGGEPLFQIDFTRELLRSAKDNDLHCCVETCGYAAPAQFEQVLEYVDLFLYDVKDTNDERHVAGTGVSNAPILANLRLLHDAGASIILRLPIIPGWNDRDDHFEGVASLAASLPDLLGVEVMPYHRLGGGKRSRLGHPAAAKSPPTPDDETIQSWIAKFRRLGVPILNQVKTPVE